MQKEIVQEFRYEFLRIRLHDEINVGDYCAIIIDFQVEMHGKMVGLYSSSYKNNPADPLSPTT